MKEEKWQDTPVQKDKATGGNGRRATVRKEQWAQLWRDCRYEAILLSRQLEGRG